MDFLGVPIGYMMDFINRFVGNYGLTIVIISILFKMAAVGLIVTIICQILKKFDRDDIATMVSIVGMVIVLGIVVGMIGDLFKNLGDVFGFTWG